MRYFFTLLTAVAGCAAGPQFDERWNTCIAAGYFAGDRIKNETTGKIGVVKEVHGQSTRCPAHHPALANVEYP